MAVPQGGEEPDAISRATGMEYTYDGDQSPSPTRRWAVRTILTGEGGSTPSRFKHLIQSEDGRYRRLTPASWRG